MKRIQIIIFTLGLSIYSFVQISKQIFIEEFIIGESSYLVYKESKFLHDDNLFGEYFVVYKKNNKTRLCSSFITAKRNDTIFTKGSYLHTSQKLIFKEYYYNHQNERVLDSIKKIFYPNKNGDLILQEVIEFKNGEATKVK